MGNPAASCMPEAVLCSRDSIDLSLYSFHSVKRSGRKQINIESALLITSNHKLKNKKTQKSEISRNSETRSY